MTPRQMKMPEKSKAEPEEHFSQRKRPESGRYVLQVDRQTKGSYQTANPLNWQDLRSRRNIPSFTSPSMTALTLPARCSHRPRQNERS